jgi:hypothetical protein
MTLIHNFVDIIHKSPFETLIIVTPNLLAVFFFCIYFPQLHKGNVPELI